MVGDTHRGRSASREPPSTASVSLTVNYRLLRRLATRDAPDAVSTAVGGCMCLGFRFSRRRKPLAVTLRYGERTSGLSPYLFSPVRWYFASRSEPIPPHCRRLSFG